MSLGVDLDVDLDHNRAEASINLRIDELFVDDELRLWESDAGWVGIRRADDAYYYVDTTLDQDAICRDLRIGQQAVTSLIQTHIADPQAGGVGEFKRRCQP